MKSVLMSVQPKWCEKIAHIIGKNGTKPIYEKSVEIRKTRPKIETPFKCYIYCTQGKFKDLGVIGNEMYQKRMKVIGEFVCDDIKPFESEFVDDNCYEFIASLDYDEDGDATGFIEWSNDSEIPYESTDFYKKCCVKYEELKKYIGLGINDFYAWHISNLVIYDKPKELSEFKKECKLECDMRSLDNPPCDKCEDLVKSFGCGRTITRPPQSWCYVERKDDEK